MLQHFTPPAHAHARPQQSIESAGHSDVNSSRLHLRSSEHRGGSDHALIDSSILLLVGKYLLTWSGAAAASTSVLKAASGPCPRRRCTSLKASTCSAAAQHIRRTRYEVLLQLRRAANAGA
jgi:hypothetical protein